MKYIGYRDTYSLHQWQATSQSLPDSMSKAEFGANSGRILLRCEHHIKACTCKHTRYLLRRPALLHSNDRRGSKNSWASASAAQNEAWTTSSICIFTYAFRERQCTVKLSNYKKLSIAKSSSNPSLPAKCQQLQCRAWGRLRAQRKAIWQTMIEKLGPN